uniref:Phospholipid scramblase n=1 Tax=Anas platyrhynchos TaxID=8839 RepID=A0A8B9TI62_ANAPL
SARSGSGCPCLVGGELMDISVLFLCCHVHDVFLGFESNNKYEIKNTLGQRIYFAVEDTDCCTRNFCGPSRPFTIRVMDNLGQCSSCCFPCCLQEVKIQAPPGTPVGYVVQNWHPCLPKFTIQDERRMDVLKISGPCVVCSCCEDVNFEVCNAKIVCVYLLSDSLTIVCCFTYYQFLSNNFGVAFPMDLDVKIKAVMIGACFLIVMITVFKNSFMCVKIEKSYKRKTALQTL